MEGRGRGRLGFGGLLAWAPAWGTAEPGPGGRGGGGAGGAVRGDSVWLQHVGGGERAVGLVGHQGAGGWTEAPPGRAPGPAPASSPRSSGSASSPARAREHWWGRGRHDNARSRTGTRRGGRVGWRGGGGRGGVGGEGPGRGHHRDRHQPPRPPTTAQRPPNPTEPLLARAPAASPSSPPHPHLARPPQAGAHATGHRSGAPPAAYDPRDRATARGPPAFKPT